MLGNVACIFIVVIFLKNSFRYIITVSSSFDPDEALRSVEPHLGLNFGIILAQNIMEENLFQPKLISNYAFSIRFLAENEQICQYLAQKEK